MMVANKQLSYIRINEQADLLLDFVHSISIMPAVIIYMVRYNCSQEISCLSEARTTMKSPRRVIMKAVEKEHIDNEGSSFSPRSLFALPPDGGSLELDSFTFGDEISDHDLLLDVPSNNSFPQAELLHPGSGFGTQLQSTSSSSAYPHLLRP